MNEPTLRWKLMVWWSKRRWFIRREKRWFIYLNLRPRSRIYDAYIWELGKFPYSILRGNCSLKTEQPAEEWRGILR